jgi:hypothetical protein
MNPSSPHGTQASGLAAGALEVRDAALLMPAANQACTQIPLAISSDWRTMDAALFQPGKIGLGLEEAA